MIEVVLQTEKGKNEKIQT